MQVELQRNRQKRENRIARLAKDNIHLSQIIYLYILGFTVGN